MEEASREEQKMEKEKEEQKEKLASEIHRSGGSVQVE